MANFGSWFDSQNEDLEKILEDTNSYPDITFDLEAEEKRNLLHHTYF